MKDSKNLALMILKGKKGGDNETSEDEDMDEDVSKEETLAEDILDSVKNEDAEALAITLKDFIRACTKSSKEDY